MYFEGWEGYDEEMVDRRQGKSMGSCGFQKAARQSWMASLKDWFRTQKSTEVASKEEEDLEGTPRGVIGARETTGGRILGDLAVGRQKGGKVGN